MTDQELKPHWQDWTSFGLRWVFLIGMSLAVFITRYQAQTTGNVDYTDIATAFGIGVTVTLVLGACAYVKSLQATVPYVLTLGDWVLAVVYVLLVKDDIILLIGIMSYLSLSGLLRTGPN